MVLIKLCGDRNRDGNGDGDRASTKKSLPLRLAPKEPNHEPLVEIHPVTAGDDSDGIIVKVQPPKHPENPNLHHVPCDLVLSIDVSGSMRSPAPAPSNPDEKDDGEDSGLSVLDLVKHAARTILETLDSNDRLGIVTFSGRSKVLQSLTPMTTENKAVTLKRIEGMEPLDITNLWHGILDGLKLFNKGNNADSTGRVPALLVLTDGRPNSMCPPQGYVPKLRTMEPLPATIHTFGFGYNLRSGLLKSIAEVGRGNYSFIPDAGMIGTVFVHAVANLQSTFANNAKLRLTYPSYLALEETTGEAVDKQEPVELEGDVPESLFSLTIHLSNLQYGQSRDIYLRYGNPMKSILASAEDNSPPVITAVLEYQHFTPTIHRATAHQNPLTSPSGPSLDEAETAFHISRSLLIAFLSTLSPLNPTTSEHQPLGVDSLPSDLPQRFQTLVTTLPATRFYKIHQGCRALLTDLVGGTDLLNLLGSEPSITKWTGQIALALLNTEYYRRWGTHYLPSLAGAHARQVCNSFKDAGPLQYGVDSPLFVACRDRLDAAFDALPAPEPSLLKNNVQGWQRSGDAGGSGGWRWVGGGGGGVDGYRKRVSMSRYNDVGNGCFAGCMPVLLTGHGGEEGKMVRVGRLRRGMEVATPRGARRVVAVLRMPVKRAEMCLVAAGKGKGGLLVTPWHPIALREGGPWAFPKDVALRLVRYTGSVYSVMLEEDEDPDAHAIFVGGMWGVTMGHGLTQADELRDVRAHQFYGGYEKVKRALSKLPRMAGGLALGGGLTRDSRTGLVDGFRRTEVGQVKAMETERRKSVVCP